MPLRRLEHVRGHAEDFARVSVLGVEEVEEQLEPAVDDVHLGLGEGFLGRGFVGKGRHEEVLDGHEDFFPETRHDSYHGCVGEGLFHNGEVFVEVGEEWLESVFDVLGSYGWCGGLALFPEVGHGGGDASAEETLKGVMGQGVVDVRGELRMLAYSSSL